MLTKTQTEFYRENGYLFVPDVYGPDDVVELNAVTDGFIDRSRSLTASDDVIELDPGHSADRPKLRRIKDPCDNHPVYGKALRNPRLISILKSLIGDSIRFDHSKLNIKPVGGGAGIDWHQDWAFYPHTNDDILAVGVLLSDVTPEQGPLQVVPGSHRGPVFNHHSNGVFCGAISDEESATIADRAVALTGQAGGITIHHVRTIHGSTPNRGSVARKLLLLSFASVDAWPLVQNETLESFNARVMCGDPTLAPRQESLPIRLPIPRVEGDASIFDNQRHKASKAS